MRGQKEKEKGKKSDKEKGFRASMSTAEEGKGIDLEDRIAMMERKIDRCERPSLKSCPPPRPHPPSSSRLRHIPCSDDGWRSLLESTDGGGLQRQHQTDKLLVLQVTKKRFCIAAVVRCIRHRAAHFFKG